MKHMKKIMALVIAMAMILGTLSLSAIAAPGELPNYDTLTVSGLGKDDVVEYYQILAWDENVNTTAGWVWGSGISESGTMRPLPNGTANITPSDVYGTNDHQNNITFDMAGQLGQNLVLSEAKKDGVNTDGTWTVSGVAPGLYMVVVTSKTPGVIYNPIFVSSNFYGPNETGVADSSWIVTSDKSYKNETHAKKTTVPLEKKVIKNEDYDTATKKTELEETNPATPYTTDIGEVVTFEVDTTIPKFGANYVKPVFNVTDELTGLTLEGNPTVELNDGTAVDDSNYVLTVDPTGKSYKIEFNDTYLSGLGNPTDIVITYKARVTEDAEQSVNQENNTVTLNFSANPQDDQGKAQLKDETNHFTFSLDAELFGSQYGNESGSEAIKVGKDKDGNYILESKDYHSYGTTVKHAALEGAEFKLFTDPDCQIPYVDGDGNERTATSDSMGRITIKGLDQGTYYLKETKAPKGWIKAQDPVEVVIDAVINENVTVTDEYDVDGTTITTTHVTNELVSYSVKVGGSTTTYTMENSADATSISISKIEPQDEEIVNTKGVELPSTGGIGTTLFYVTGGILVIGAGILLVTKRRMNTSN